MDSSSETDPPPRERQLRLFDPPRPLCERLGLAFFRSLPVRPGVYRMLDGRGSVLYVGQSSNLRKRLSSYRSVHPDRDSRSRVRLVHSVERIEWEECSDAEAARLRENELIRRHRPRFNRVNAHPESYLFMTLRVEEGRILIRLGRDIGSMGDVFGAFKARARFACAALVRSLWSARHAPSDWTAFPRGYLSGPSIRQATVDFRNGSSRLTDERVGEELGRFLEGASDQLLELLRGELPVAASVFQQRLHEADLETLEEFYQSGPRRNRLLSERFGLGRRLIGAAELDDLLARR